MLRVRWLGSIATYYSIRGLHSGRCSTPMQLASPNATVSLKIRAALVARRPDSTEELSRDVQLNLLDEFATEQRQRIREIAKQPRELDDQLSRLESTLSSAIAMVPVAAATITATAYSQVVGVMIRGQTCWTRLNPAIAAGIPNAITITRRTAGDRLVWNVTAYQEQGYTGHSTDR